MNQRKYKSIRYLPSLLLVLTCAFSARADNVLNLLSLSLEQLSQVQVRLTSRTAESLFDAPAAIAVVSQDQIRRSGATSLPEALRLVPGMQVARIDASKWSVSARGFADRFANKQLVLVDGRTVYNPFFAGVYWEELDIPLDEIEQIEVIRGPGAALWGANAVNGVINIVTRSAAQTQGAQLSTRLGTEELSRFGLRYGGHIGNSGHYRAYIQHSRRDATANFTDGDNSDDWQTGRLGFRADWQTNERDQYVIQGDLYHIDQDNLLRTYAPESPYVRLALDRVDDSGGHLRARWSRRISERSEMQVQLYFDRIHRRERYLQQRLHTYDIDFQHQLRQNARQKWTWGLGYRLSDDDFSDSYTLRMEPNQRRISLYNAFLHSETQLLENKLRLQLGAKSEHNAFSGFVFQPNARLLWHLNAKQLLWTAISRAVKMPARVESDGRLIIGVSEPDVNLPPVFIVASGDQENENLIAYEAGYRLDASSWFNLDLTAFIHRHLDLQTLIADLPYPETVDGYDRITAPVRLLSKNKRTTGGVEILARLRPHASWNTLLSYSYYNSGKLGATINNASFKSGPKHQLLIHQQIDITRQWQADVLLRFVDKVPDRAQKRYTSMDLRFAYKINDKLEVAFVGQNLLEKEHVEGSPSIIIDTPRGQIERGGYASLLWSF